MEKAKFVNNYIGISKFFPEDECWFSEYFCKNVGDGFPLVEHTGYKYIIIVQKGEIEVFNSVGKTVNRNEKDNKPPIEIGISTEHGIRAVVPNTKFLKIRAIFE